MKQKLLLMSGLPGSGKSTWLKKHAKDAVIICPDVIRKEILGHQFHQNAEQLIWWLTESMARMIFLQGKSVAIDATNLFPFLRRKWAAMADEYGAAKEVVWMDIDPEECWKRNIGRPKKDRVPRAAFDRMARAFCKPDAAVYDDDGFRIRRVRQ
jgi:predicted kinase